jgi:acetylornithine deacetylase/succinyl-diaminopimelate desuccinylase-like protein
VKTLANPGRHPFPWHGKNAFDLFSEDYRKLESLFPQNRIATEEHNWHSTYSLYDVQVVNDEFYGPKSVEAKINVYFTNDTTARDLFESINEEFTNSELSMFTGSERVFLEPDSVHSLSLRRIMERHFGREIALKTDNGSSDARFYAQSHIPIVIAKVVGEDHHGENEHILIDQLLPFYRSMEEFAGSFLQTKKNNEEHLCLCPNTI